MQDEGLAGLGVALDLLRKMQGTTRRPPSITLDDVKAFTEQPHLWRPEIVGDWKVEVNRSLGFEQMVEACGFYEVDPLFMDFPTKWGPDRGYGTETVLSSIFHPKRPIRSDGVIKLMAERPFNLTPTGQNIAVFLAMCAQYRQHGPEYAIVCLDYPGDFVPVSDTHSHRHYLRMVMREQLWHEGYRFMGSRPIGFRLPR